MRSKSLSLALVPPSLLAVALALSCGGRPASTTLLTTIHDVREFRRQGGPREANVELHGEVTAFDPDHAVVYLQDATGALALASEGLGSSVVPGASVVLWGTLDAGSTPARLRRPRATVLGQSDPNAALEVRPITPEALLAHDADAEWVEIHGVVRGARRGPRALILEMQAGGVRFRAAVLNQDNRYPTLVDSSVRLRGVSVTREQGGAGAADVQVLIPDVRSVRIEEEPPADPFDRPLVSPRRLAARPLAEWPEHQVRAQGSVVRALACGGFVLGVEGDEYPVTGPEPGTFAVGGGVEIAAFAASAHGALRFEEASVRPLDAGRSRSAESPQSALPRLTRASQVRGLPPEEAARGYPVQLSAVVTYTDPEQGLLFVSDESAGIYVEAWRHIHHLQSGDRVEISGLSARGSFAPIVDRPRVRVRGHGPLPAPRRVRPEDLVTGKEDSQWVEVEGVVRAVKLDRFGAFIRLAVGELRVPLMVPQVKDRGLAGRLVNARLRVRGVPRSLLTFWNQLADITLQVPDVESLKVVQPPPFEPFALPVHPINTLLQFDPGQNWEHRVRVQGVVTYSQPGEVYVRDETGGVNVHTDRSYVPAVGDRVDVIGFAGRGEYKPMLEDAALRPLGVGKAEAAVVVTPEEATSGRFDAGLVTLEARLLDVVRGRDEQQFLMRAGPYLFPAVLRWPGGEGLREGSVLRVTGICAVSANDYRVPQAFRLLLRTPADVQVLHAAPWWTSRYTLWVLSAMAVAVGLALTWAATLRRRVAAQSAVIWERVKHETELQERQRMARELHDTLEQNLVGIGLCVEAASRAVPEASGVAVRHLSLAIEQVSTGIEAVRRSVWALRPRALDTHGLSGALDEIGRQLAACSAARIEVRTCVRGEIRPLPAAVENDLLRIGQEALTNAVRHGKALHIEVELRYEEEAFCLSVRDDGRGFDPSQPPRPGHFGLLGMRERAAAMGARLELRSALSRGTEVEVSVPKRPLRLAQVG